MLEGEEAKDVGKIVVVVCEGDGVGATDFPNGLPRVQRAGAQVETIQVMRVVRVAQPSWRIYLPLVVRNK